MLTERLYCLDGVFTGMELQIIPKKLLNLFVVSFFFVKPLVEFIFHIMCNIPEVQTIFIIKIGIFLIVAPPFGALGHEKKGLLISQNV